MGKERNPYLPKTHRTYKAIKAGCPKMTGINLFGFGTGSVSRTIKSTGN
jgi:hypothetical protein